MVSLSLDDLLVSLGTSLIRIASSSLSTVTHGTTSPMSQATCEQGSTVSMKEHNVLRSKNMAHVEHSLQLVLRCKGLRSPLFVSCFFPTFFISLATVWYNVLGVCVDVAYMLGFHVLHVTGGTDCVQHDILGLHQRTVMFPFES